MSSVDKSSIRALDNFLIPALIVTLLIVLFFCTKKLFGSGPRPKLMSDFVFFENNKKCAYKRISQNDPRGELGRDALKRRSLTKTASNGRYESSPPADLFQEQLFPDAVGGPADWPRLSPVNFHGPPASQAAHAQNGFCAIVVEPDDPGTLDVVPGDGVHVVDRSPAAAVREGSQDPVAFPDEEDFEMDFDFDEESFVKFDGPVDSAALMQRDYRSYLHISFDADQESG